MRTCEKLKDYVDWLDDGHKALPPKLQAHLEACADCRKAVSDWQRLNAHIGPADAYLYPVDAPLPHERALLIQRLSNRQKSRPLMRQWKVIGAAAVAVILIVGTFYAWRSLQKPNRIDPPIVAQGVILAESGRRDLTMTAGKAPVDIPAGARAVLQLGKDTVGIDSNSRVRLAAGSREDTRIVIEQGQISCQVAPRQGNEQFTVVAGDVRVRVVGTRFSVTKTKSGTTKVAVAEGRVVVDAGDKGHWAIPPGEQIEVQPSGDGSRSLLSPEQQEHIAHLLADTHAPHLSPPVAKKTSSTASNRTSLPLEEAAPSDSAVDSPTEARHASDRKASFSRWQRWIIDGRIADAEAALSAHVKRHPKDFRAWSLLASCYRKQGQFNAAVEAYEIVAKQGRTKEAMRSRFRAGAILQDELRQQRRAATHFETYLSQLSGAMRAEAMWRLARCYKAMGRNRDAMALLEAITREHRGSTAAEKAIKMRSKMRQ